MATKAGVIYGVASGCLMLAIPLFCMLGCGGAKKGGSRTCEENYLRLRNQENDALCEPVAVNRFEIQVTTWRESCPTLAEGPQGRQLDDKLLAVQSCSDTKRHIERKRQDCLSRLALAAEGQSCLGVGCLKYWNYLKRIHVDCETPDMGGVFAKEISQLRALLEERTRQGNRILALDQLTAMCDSFRQASGEKQAKAAMNQILERVPLVERGAAVPVEGSEVFASRETALGLCDEMLVQSLTILTAAVTRKLNTRSVAKSPRRRERHMRKLTEMYGRMAAAETTWLFPRATAFLTETILRYDSSWDKNAPMIMAAAQNEQEGDVVEIPVIPDEVTGEAPLTDESPAAEEEDVVEIPSAPISETPDGPAIASQPGASANTAASAIPPNPYEPWRVGSGEERGAVSGNRTAARDRVLLNQARKQCREVQKHVRQFAAKVDEYQKKGKENKVRAYEMKLDTMNRKLQDLFVEIETTLKKTTLAPKERDELSNKLADSGCLPVSNSRH